MTNRIHWVDYAKAFGIFGVVLLHTGVEETVSHSINMAVIPLFFFLSGLFAPSYKKSSFFPYLLKRNGKVLVSYLFFNLITFAFWYYLGRFYGADVHWDIEPKIALKGILIANTSSLVHCAPLWFIACLMVVQTAHHLIYFFIKNKYVQIMMCILIFIVSYFFYALDIRQLPWGLDVAFSMISYFTAGFLLKDFLFAKDNWYNNDVRIQALIAVVSFVIMVVIYHLNIKPKVATNNLGHYFLFTIGAFTSIFAIISVFKIIERYFGNIKFISYVGENTLIILALHLMAASVVKAIVFWGFKLPLSIFNEPGMSYVLSVLSILALMPIIYFINRFLPFTVGRKYIAK